MLFGKLARDRDTGRFHIALATGGHLPALLLDSDSGSIRPVRSPGGMLVGAISDATFESCEVTLSRGQTLLLYTDGIVEARPDGSQLSASPRFGYFCPSGPGCRPPA